jgi:hypothetical protein
MQCPAAQRHQSGSACCQVDDGSLLLWTGGSLAVESPTRPGKAVHYYPLASPAKYCLQSAMSACPHSLTRPLSLAAPECLRPQTAIRKTFPIAR